MPFPVVVFEAGSQRWVSREQNFIERPAMHIYTLRHSNFMHKPDPKIMQAT